MDAAASADKDESSALKETEEKVEGEEKAKEVNHHQAIGSQSSSSSSSPATATSQKSIDESTLWRDDDLGCFVKLLEVVPSKIESSEMTTIPAATATATAAATATAPTGEQRIHPKSRALLDGFAKKMKQAASEASLQGSLVVKNVKQSVEKVASSPRRNLLMQQIASVKKNQESSIPSSVKQQVIDRGEPSAVEAEVVIEDPPSPSPSPPPITEITNSVKSKFSLLRNNKSESESDHAHLFAEHTYKSPTTCDICSGLLVGLWSQGFQCHLCGMSVHRGQGVGEHDDCRAEALFMTCPGPLQLDTTTTATTTTTQLLTEAEKKKKEANSHNVVAQLRELALNNPNFVRDIAEQINRDVKARAKNMITTAAVEDEQTKNLQRIRTKVVIPLVKRLDAIDAYGEISAVVLLLGIQAAVSLLLNLASFFIFIIVLAPKHGFLEDTAIRLAALHNATVTTSLHIVLAVLSILLYRLSCLFKRKDNLIDRYCRDALQIDAEEAIGISISDAAARAKKGATRFLVVEVMVAVIAMAMWHESQPAFLESSSSLPPIANIAVSAASLTLCAGVVAVVVYRTASPEVGNSAKVGEVEIAAIAGAAATPEKKTDHDVA